jgi:hypothetical protein
VAGRTFLAWSGDDCQRYFREAHTCFEARHGWRPGERLLSRLDYRTLATLVRPSAIIEIISTNFHLKMRS